MYTITGRFTGLSLRGRDMFERATAQHVYYYRSVHRLIVKWKRHVRTSHRSTCPLLQVGSPAYRYVEETCSNESPLNMSTISGRFTGLSLSGRDMFERATAQHVHYYRSVHRLIVTWKRHVRTSHRSTCLLLQVGSPAYRYVEETCSNEPPLNMSTITGWFTGLSLSGRDMFERVTAQHVHYYRSVYRLIVTWKRHVRTSHRSTCPLLQVGSPAYRYVEETCSNEPPLNMSTITGRFTGLSLSGRDMFERATAQHVHYYRSVHRLIVTWKRHVRTSHRSTCPLLQVGSPVYR